MSKGRRKARVPNVIVGVRALETRLAVAEAQGLAPDQLAAANGVRELLRRAEEAACGIDPEPGLLGDRWSGRLVEAAYEFLHMARAQAVDVYDEAELAAEIPAAVARAQQTLHRDDPRRLGVELLSMQSVAHQRALLRRAIEDSYDSLDRQHERLRSFRNIILVLAGCIAALVVTTIAVVTSQPSIMPLCFPAVAAAADGSPLLNCPTGTRVASGTGLDIITVSMLGLLGGALAAAMSIRNLRGTSVPYDVPVALSMLKVPLGAFTAILGLVAIRGDFVPGLSRLDSQQQILAYALLLGFAQQVFTHSLDRRAQSLLESLPAKDQSAAPSAAASAAIPTMASVSPGPVTAAAPSAAPSAAPPTPSAPSAEEATPIPVQPVTITLPEAASEPDYQPPPPVEGDDVVQDDGSEPMPAVPIGDHR